MNGQSTPQEPGSAATKRSQALGGVIGVGAALLLLSAATTLLGVVMAFFLTLSLGAVFVVPVVVGWIVGRRFARDRQLPDLSWPRLVAGALILWSGAVALPLGLRTVQLYALGIAAVPTYPGAVRSDLGFMLLPASDAGPRVTFHFEAVGTPAEIRDHYRRRLLARGWAEGPENLRNARFASTTDWYEKRRWFGGRLLALWVTDGDSQRGSMKFAVTFYLN